MLFHPGYFCLNSPFLRFFFYLQKANLLCFSYCFFFFSHTKKIFLFYLSMTIATNLSAVLYAPGDLRMVRFKQYLFAV